LAGAGLILGHLRNGLQGGNRWKETISSFLAVDVTARIISFGAAGSILRRFEHGGSIEAIDQGGQLDRTGGDVIRHRRSALLGSVVQVSPITNAPVARGNDLRCSSEG
jgi:hypothetical protein